MRTQNQPRQLMRVPAMTLLSSLFLVSIVFGQTQTDKPSKKLTETWESVAAESSDYVSIQVDGGTMRQVLNAFAIQTQRNVVIGPDVISEDVNIHLNRVRWDDALEVILKPYGYGYRNVGETIVISKLENLTTLAAVEPVATRVFDLRFSDASDVQEMLAGQLSGRGSISIMKNRGQKGWEFAAQSRSESRSGASLAKRARLEDAEQMDAAKSKTIVVTDIPSILDRIETILEKVDRKPSQVLVEAKFIEVNDNYLRDIGVELSGSFEIDGDPLGAAENFFDAKPNAFNPASTDMTGKRTLNTFSEITFESGSASLLINLIQEDDDSKILSAPSVLTLNNQEATIIVGQKYPIIESDVSGSGGDSITSTTLDYYENIGIQLNVVPQISDQGYINMIVHPSVSSIVGEEQGVVSSGDSAQSLTTYPIINIREAETQILLKNSETAVIGGLLEERDSTTQFKIPLLGDIPILGHLFRRNVDNKQTVDLLIFLSATVVDIDTYSQPVEEPIAETLPELLSEPLSEPLPEPVAGANQEQAASELPPVPGDA